MSKKTLKHSHKQKKEKLYDEQEIETLVHHDAQLLDGVIVKALSGYYYVQPLNNRNSSSTVQCRARGVFKMKKISPLVGDYVAYNETENNEGFIMDIKPRHNELIRPPVANVDIAVLVFSVTEPTLNLQLLDKFILHIEHAGIRPILCLSKQDLSFESNLDEAGRNEALKSIEAVQRIYTKLGYEVFGTSAKQEEGLHPLHEVLQGKVAVFAGQSGVGKSSLLNALVPGINLETNEISNRLGRGKHTTRHVELIDVGGGYVADTPGFSQLDFNELGISDLGYGFIEIRHKSIECKFRGCTHVHEPSCAVREAVSTGEIEKTRYEHYLLFLTEMNEQKRRY